MLKNENFFFVVALLLSSVAIIFIPDRNNMRFLLCREKSGEERRSVEMVTGSSL